MKNADISLEIRTATKIVTDYVRNCMRIYMYMYELVFHSTELTVAHAVMIC